MRNASVIVIVLTLCALFSGASLLAAVIGHVSLGATLVIFGICAAVIATVSVRLTPAQFRRELALRAGSGAIGGIVGVIAYDAARLSIVGVFHLHVRPLEALPLFGTLIVGAIPGSKVSWVVGWMYHYLNGIMFGTSYGIAFARRIWLWGIPFALCLETLMLLLYPGWLHIRPAVLEEFTAVSLCGHIAYGCGLGLTASSMMRRIAPAPH